MNSLLQSLFTVITSALVAALVSHWLIRSRENEIFRRQKLEELYRYILDFKTMIDISIIAFEMYVIKDRDEQGYWEAMSKDRHSDDEKFAMRKIQAIVNLWFPEFSETLEKLDDRRSNVVKMANAQKYYSSDGNEFPTNFRHKTDELEMAFNEFLFLISKKAENINTRKIL